MKEIRKWELSGFPTDEVQPFETEHRKVARRAAAQGMVLLKNEDDVLPIAKSTSIALYGEGAYNTIKGGTGSGDVNARETVNIWQGLENAGYTIANRDWLEDYKQKFDDAHIAWREEIWKKLGENGNDMMKFWDAYGNTKFVKPVQVLPEEKMADVAMYVIARNAGEGADRFNKEGDYQLTKEEDAFIARLNELYSRVVLILNTGGLIDLGFTEKYPNIKSILYVHQPGMEAGNAVADIISGAVTPSGKLTDTWAMKYEDYPCADTFSHNNGDLTREEYKEGIFVGYRYFDTFNVPVRYGFGYGLSYTSFSVKTIGIRHHDLGTEDPSISVTAEVKNTGKADGREVVEVYVSCPQGRLVKEFRRLVGFAKTKLLKPGETEELEIRFPLYALASYDGFLPGWVMEKGEYILLVGTSLADSEAVGIVRADDELVFTKTENVCEPHIPIPEITPDPSALEERRNALVRAISARTPYGDMPIVGIHEGDVKTKTIEYGPAYDDCPAEVLDLVKTLTTDECIDLVTGDIKKGQGAAENDSGQFGAAGNAVPGSAAQTVAIPEKGIADIVLADGPAGLRLNRTYPVKNGYPVQQPFMASVEGGFLAEGHLNTGLERRYQNLTAIPVGTLLAQSWDPETVKECGRIVADEMHRYGVTLWLAPGMNIHRNPLCGRNFEYFSEDPLIAGLMAAAMTEGVQSVAGCGTTIKHYFCNNSEDNRMGVDCIVSERAIREIYVKGFEIAVKKSQPMSIMTSYNQVNGVHSANNYDSCTKLARNEWGFKGVIMTDWTTTTDSTAGESTASGCMRAGNDLIMPGDQRDHDNLKEELAKGTLKEADLRRSVARLVNIVWKSDRYVD